MAVIYLLENRGEDFAEFIGCFLNLVSDEGFEHRGYFNLDCRCEYGRVLAGFLEVDAEAEGDGASFGREAYAACGDALADFKHELSDGGGFHTDAVTVEFDAVELFAMLFGELVDERAVLAEVSHTFVYLSDGTG